MTGPWLVFRISARNAWPVPSTSQCMLSKYDNYISKLRYSSSVHILCSLVVTGTSINAMHCNRQLAVSSDWSFEHTPYTMYMVACVLLLFLNTLHQYSRFRVVRPDCQGHSALNHANTYLEHHTLVYMMASTYTYDESTCEPATPIHYSHDWVQRTDVNQDYIETLKLYTQDACVTRDTCRAT